MSSVAFIFCLLVAFGVINLGRFGMTILFVVLAFFGYRGGPGGPPCSG